MSTMIVGNLGWMSPIDFPDYYEEVEKILTEPADGEWVPVWADVEDELNYVLREYTLTYHKDTGYGLHLEIYKDPKSLERPKPAWTVASHHGSLPEAIAAAEAIEACFQEPDRT